MRARIAVPLLVFCVAVVIIASLTTPVLAADGIMNLYVGQYVADNGIPHEDPFTVEGADRPWIAQQWLSSLLFYSFYDVGGYAAFGGISILLAASAYALFVAMLQGAGVPPLRALIAGIAVLGATFLNTFVRAQTLTLPLFVICLTLIVLDGRRRTASPRYLVPIFAMLVLWANLHGSVLIAIAPIGLLALVRGVRALRGRAFGVAARYAAFGIAIALAPLATPYGLDVISYYTSVVSNDTISESITEWYSTSFGNPVSWPFLALLGTAIVVVARHPRRGWPFDSLYVLAGFYALIATQAIRYHLWAGFALTALIACTLWLGEKAPSRSRSRPLTFAALAMAVGALIVIAAVAAQDERKWFRTAPVVQVDAATRCMEADPELRVLADARAAGPLLWFHPDVTWGRIAFDGRLEHFSQPRLQDWFDWSRASSPEWLDVAEGYDLMISSRTLHPDTANRLEQLDGWTTVSSDSKGVLVARDGVDC